MLVFDYNPELNKIKEAIQQVYRDFALKYGEIQKSKLSENEKQAKIKELVENSKTSEAILRSTESLSELSDEDKEDLGIKEEDKTVIDDNIINNLVSIYSRMAKMPIRENRNVGLLKNLTLEEGEKLEEIDTSRFEEELKQYFTEHYSELFSAGYNDFLSEITEVPDGVGRIVYSDKYGDLTKMAMKYNINPEKFKNIGYQIVVQDGLIAEEDSTFIRNSILYATPDGINKRIFDLYSKTLFLEHRDGKSVTTDEMRNLKNSYISYSEKNGIEITNPDVLETLEIDMAKVQGIAKYINKVVNNRKNVEKGDYTQLFQDEIIKNYSKIMNLRWYNFLNLESVKNIVGENSFIESLYLRIEDDNIIFPNERRPGIAYGTPEYIRREYKILMEEIIELSYTDAFSKGYFAIEEANKKKEAFREYIKDNKIEGIDISIPEIEIDHKRTEMIADAILNRFGSEYENKKEMRERILKKVEDRYSEMFFERQTIELDDLIGEELRDMGSRFSTERLYMQEDFIYIGDFSGFNGECIYATPEAIAKKIKILDEKISNSDFNFDQKRIREQLLLYSREHKFNINIPSVESIEDRGIMARHIFAFEGNSDDLDFERTWMDDPTARVKIELNDSLLEVITKMSEGVPGAITGIAEVMKSDENGFMLLLSLDDMNIRGSQIWEAYKYLYNENGKKFAEAISKRDSKMVDFINQEFASVGGEKAVISGASFDRNREPDKYRFTEKEVEELKAQKKERIEKQKAARDKMIANSPAKKMKMGQKRREERQAKRNKYRERLMEKGKKSISELDEELTSLQEKEEKAKDLYNKYEQQLESQTKEGREEE